MVMINAISSVNLKSNKNTIIQKEKASQTSFAPLSTTSFKGENADKISSQTLSANFQAAQNINRSNNISFKGCKIDDIPSNWELNSGGTDRVDADSCWNGEHSNGSLKSYMKEHLGSLLEFFQYTGIGQYGPDGHFDGCIVIGNDGQVNHRSRLTKEDLENIKLNYKDITSYMRHELKASPKDLLDVFDKHGQLENQIDELFAKYYESQKPGYIGHYEYDNYHYKDIIDVLTGRLIEEGRIDKVIENPKSYIPKAATIELIKTGRLDEAIKLGTKADVAECLIDIGRIGDTINLRTECYDEFGQKNLVCDKLLKMGDIDKAIEMFGYNKQICSELLKLGRHQEFIQNDGPSKVKENMPYYLVEYTDHFHTCVGPYCKNMDNVIEAFNFIDNNLDLEKLAQEKREKAINTAQDFWQEKNPIKRGAKAIFTLGISEILSAKRKNDNKNENLKTANLDISEKRNMIADIVNHELTYREDVLVQKYERAEKIASLETKKEAVKSEIQKEFIDLIDLDQKKKFVEEFPNCLMLTGENTPLMQDLIDWTGENTDCNYVKVPYIINNDDHQEAIGEALEKAEDSYQKTGKRSLIYVNGLEKLINPKLNDFENIECMKNLMNKADTNFHSTLIFTAKDPSKLDNIAIQPNRVTNIDVPITFYETRI